MKMQQRVILWGMARAALHGIDLVVSALSEAARMKVANADSVEMSPDTIDAAMFCGNQAMIAVTELLGALGAPASVTAHRRPPPWIPPALETKGR